MMQEREERLGSQQVPTIQDERRPQESTRQPKVTQTQPSKRRDLRGFFRLAGWLEPLESSCLTVALPGTTPPKALPHAMPDRFQLFSTLGSAPPMLQCLSARRRGWDTHVAAAEECTLKHQRKAVCRPLENPFVRGPLPSVNSLEYRVPKAYKQSTCAQSLRPAAHCIY
jgi:hypothetical protein